MTNMGAKPTRTAAQTARRHQGKSSGSDRWPASGNRTWRLRGPARSGRRSPWRYLVCTPYGQHHAGWMSLAYMNNVMGHDRGKHAFGETLTGIRIDIETREVAAGHVQPDTMAGLEQHAGGPEFDRHLDDLFLRQWFVPLCIDPPIARTCLGEGAQPCTHDPILHVHRVAFGIVHTGRILIDQLGGEIGIDRR